MKLTHICNFHQSLDLTNVKPIKNIKRNKPEGGIWLSINNGWEKWCASESPAWLEGTRYVATLKPKARILWINSSKDLEHLPDNPKMDEYTKLFGPSEKYLDFEKLEKKYDAIAVMAQSGKGLYSSLYGWDCDSMVVFHPEIIESMQETAAYHNR